MTKVSCNDQPLFPNPCRWHCILTLMGLNVYGEFTAVSLITVVSGTGKIQQ